MADEHGKGMSKKTKRYLMIGGGVALLLPLFLSKKGSGGQKAAVVGTDPSQPVYMGANPGGASYGGGGGGGGYSGYDASAQMSAINDSLNKLQTILTTPQPAPTPSPTQPAQPTLQTKSIAQLQGDYQTYAKTHPGANADNDGYLGMIHAQANVQRQAQISQLQTDYQNYVKAHPGADTKNTAYLAQLHAQADTLRGQLKGG